MPTVNRSALVPFSASDMYALVCDIEAYPQFLPWCNSASIEHSTDTRQTACVGIDAKISQTTFTTNNILVPGERIEMTLADGPFKHLNGNWVFKPLGDEGCKVELEVEFEFSSATLAAVIGPAFTLVCDSIVNAFVKRAQETLT